ncbi:unnamed protein product [Periconia digitata]|uniref:C2H2-type domain-containing protein n=1 Tax=Periconia digitata TaxID=1303443 RepID=A0A9W4U7S2_9PLEO|nr:unnamed protein product [Periconia digitata]
MMTCKNVPYGHEQIQSPQHGTVVQLPRLKIAAQKDVTGRDSPRRDSLSSSTGDSGYNSDPDTDRDGDAQFSPLVFGGLEHALYTSLDITSSLPLSPKITGFIVPKPKGEIPVYTAKSPLFKRNKSLQNPLPPPKIEVTSCPTSSPNCEVQSALKTSDTSKGVAPPSVPPDQHKDDASRQENIEQWIDLNLQARPKERNPSIVSFSSSGSCDMYSSNNNSEDEDTGPSNSLAAARGSKLSKATLKTIELILRKIELNLNYAAYIQCLEGPHIRQRPGTTSRSTSRGNTNRSHANNASKRKSRPSDDLLPQPPDDPSDDDENNPNKRRRISVATTASDSDSGPRFACPFYKHDPVRFRTRRTCPGPGWTTVHRMKEHLYRAHGQPVYCPRCFTTFSSSTDLSSHLRADSCPVSEPLPIEGIDLETQNTLKKRSVANRLEEDKWRDAYMLLFPDVDVDDIPSPYYTTHSPTEDSRRFRRMLMDRVRTELLATAERGPNTLVEQRVLRQVASIIQNCESELLSSFQSSSANPSISTPSFSMGPGQNSSSSRRTSHTGLPTSVSEEFTPAALSQARRPIFRSPFDAPSSAPTQPPPNQQIANSQPQSSQPMSPGTFSQPQPHPPPPSSFPPSNIPSVGGPFVLDPEGPGAPPPTGLVEGWEFSSSIDWDTVFAPGVDFSLEESQYGQMHGNRDGVGDREVVVWT